MKCDEVLTLIPAYALGDLDVEPRREVDDHLAACAACRAEADRSSLALGDLRSLPPVETAESRRDRAVEAMQREHAARVEGILLRPRRRWPLWIASAAAMLAVIAASAVVLLRGPGTEFRVTEGRGHVLHDGAWTVAQAGTILRAGDRLVTDRDTSVRLTFEGGWILVHSGTSITFGRDRRIELDRGELSGELAGPLRIQTLGNDALLVRSGRFDVGLRETIALVAGTFLKIPAKPPGADVIFEDRPFAEVAAEVSRISGRPIRPAGDEVGRTRVWFYGVRSRGASLADDLEAAVRDQGLWFRDGVANLVYHAEKRGMARRLFARVSEGEASLSSPGGSVNLRAGDEGVVVSGSPPALLKGAAAEWRRIPIPGTLAFRVAGRDADGRLIVEAGIEGAELLEGGAVIRIESSTGSGGGEVVVPLRIRIESKP
jgi:hypothetical protein